MALKKKDAVVEIEQRKDKEIDKIRTSGRKKGTPNGVSPVRLLNALTDNNFHLVNEMIDFYRKEKCIYDQMYDMASDPTLRETMSDTQLELFNMTAKEIAKMQIKMASHCFATMKAIEIDTGTGDRTIFNISIPAPTKSTKLITEGSLTLTEKDGSYTVNDKD